MASRIWLGLFFLVFGVGFLLHQAHVIDFPEILSTWWPLIIIFIGIIQIFNRNYSSGVSGLLFVLVGALFLFNHLFDLNLIVYLWPLIFIFVGIAIMFTRVTRERTAHTDEDLNTQVLLSGAEIKSQSKRFQGGNITTILGGADIDLREAMILEEGATMDLTTILGGVNLTVPEHIHVEFSGLPILGGWEDKTRVRSEKDKQIVLKLNCLTILGGVEVKN